MWAGGGDHAGIDDLAVAGDSVLEHLEYIVDAARHAIADALGEADEIVG